MTGLLVVFGAVVGAPTRYLVDAWVRSRHDSPMPWGTFLVNATGSLVLGLAAGLASEGTLPSWALTLVGTGFCGALTTFSTFSYETVRLVDDGRWRTAALNVVSSLAVGLGACALGWLLGTR